MKKMFVAVVVLAVVISGCSTIKSLFTNDEALLKLAVESAVAQVLHDNPGWKATTIEITAATLSAIDAKTVLDLGSTAAYVKSKIPMDKLLPPQQALASLLVDTIVQQIQAELAKKNIAVPADQLVEVRAVLGWINDIAKL